VPFVDDNNLQAISLFLKEIEESKERRRIDFSQKIEVIPINIIPYPKFSFVIK